MSVVAQVAAVATALVHLVVWVWEAFLIHRVYHTVFRQPAENVLAIRLWAFGVGFYNLCLACGVIAGLVALHIGHELVGRTLLVYTAWFMVLSSVVPAEGVPPLVVLLFL